MRWHKLAGAGLTVAAAAAVGTLISGGVGSAASSPSHAKLTTRGAAPPALSKSVVKAASVTPAASPDTSKIYLRVNGVTGEVVDGPNTNDLNVFSWSWGMNAPPGTMPTVSDINLLVPYDRAIPQLENMAEDNKTSPSVQLIEFSSTNGKIREIDLTNAKVDSIQISSSVGGGVPSVALSFTYARERTTYYYNNSTGGTSLYTSCWDVSTQTDCKTG